MRMNEIIDKLREADFYIYEEEAIEFLKVIVVCANYVKIGVEKLDESIEEVAL